jgi:hypothetical protein
MQFKWGIRSGGTREAHGAFRRDIGAISKHCWIFGAFKGQFHLMNNRQQQQQGRRRGRGRGPQGNGGRNENSSRIDNRSRGNAPQMLEKYKNMARDAQTQGDRVMTEYYLQFADHYFRIVAESKARFEEQRRQRDDWQEDGEGQYNEDQSADGYDADNGNDDEPRAREEQPRANRENREPREGRDNRRRDGRENREQSGREQNGRDPNGGGREAAPRRERNPRRPVEQETREEEEAPAMLDASILPPAFASDASVMAIEIDHEEAPAPRRRGRPRRTEANDEAGQEAA